MRRFLKKGYIGRIISALIIFLTILTFRDIVQTEEISFKRPNIILISVDTLRADHLGCYGYEKDTSPNVDEFAKEGILFKNCFSHAPVTCSSCASILSGFWPHETKVFENNPFHLEVDSIAEILKDNGYMTMAIVSNFVLRKGLGFDQGFQIFDDEMGEKESIRNLPERVAEKTTDRAIEILNKYHSQDFFMWIHYQDPHGPYAPPPPFNTSFKSDCQKPVKLKLNKTETGIGGIPIYQKLGDNRDFYYYVSQYDGEIRYFDEHFKRLIQSLKVLGIYDNSLIIFTADHGEGMGENNYYFAHGENLYNASIHVPLIIKYEKKYNEIRNDNVQHIDIVPTILDTAGISIGPKFRGRNLLFKNSNEREILSEMGDWRSAIIIDNMKLIYGVGTKKILKYFVVKEKEYLLFDLKNDPNEENCLIAHNNYYFILQDKEYLLLRKKNNRYKKNRSIPEIDYREFFEEMKDRLEHASKLDSLGLDVSSKTPKLTVEEIEKMKSLGYIQHN